MDAKPDQYDRNNTFQSTDGFKLLRRIRKEQDNGILPKELSLVVDIGSGSGNITSRIRDIVSCGQVVGIDKSPEMVAFANQQHPAAGTSYRCADISSDDVSNLQDLRGRADLVFSNHCLHWVPEEKMENALSNIRSFLKPDGRCYLILFSWSDAIPMQELMIKHPKWQQFLEPVASRIPRFKHKDEEELKHLWGMRCKHAGLKDLSIQLEKISFNFGSWTNLRKQTSSVCHFLAFIPKERHEEFCDDFYDLVQKAFHHQQQQLQLPPPDPNNLTVDYEYVLIVAQNRSQV